MEESADAIILRPVGPSVDKFSWADTARAMAASDDDWSEWDAVAADGLRAVPWTKTPAAVAESKARYTATSHSKKRARRSKS